VALEEIVYLAAVAFCALKATNNEHGHAYRDQHSKYASIHREPMCQVLHLLVTTLAGALLAHIESTRKIRCRVVVGRKYSTKVMWDGFL